MNLKLLLIPLLLLLRNSESIGFTNAEWNNPSHPGGSVWLKNEKNKPIVIASVFVKNDGFHIGNEIALKLGKRTFFFRAAKGSAGHWTRLIPQKGGKKIFLRAKDSLFASGFEYGNGLQAKKPKRKVAEEYVLDLKLVDAAGDSATVKISESSPKYIIKEAPNGADLGPGPEEWSPRASAPDIGD